MPSLFAFCPTLLRSGKNVERWQRPAHLRSEDRFLRSVRDEFLRLRRVHSNPLHLRNALNVELKGINEHIEQTRRLLAYLREPHRRYQLVDGKNPLSIFIDRHVPPPRRRGTIIRLISDIPFFGAGVAAPTALGAVFPFNLLTGLASVGIREGVESWQEKRAYHARLRDFLGRHGQDYSLHMHLKEHVDNLLVHKASEGEALTTTQKLANFKAIKAFEGELAAVERFAEAYREGLRTLHEQADVGTAVERVRAFLSGKTQVPQEPRSLVAEEKEEADRAFQKAIQRRMRRQAKRKNNK